MRHSGTVRRVLLASALLGVAACGGANTDIQAKTPRVAETQSSGILAIADELAAKGDHSAAAPLYRHAAATTGSVAAVTGLARSLCALGQYDTAENILEDLALRGGMPGDSWYLLGKSRIALGKFEGALIALDLAATLNPADTRIPSARGITLAALGRTGDAVAAFRNSVDATSLNNLALVFAMTGKADAAVNILEPLARAGEITAQGRQNLAMAYLLSGREEEARHLARLDLDARTVDDTFTFYRTLQSLPVARRMQALTTGIIAPDWSREESGNLILAENPGRTAAASRVVSAATTAASQTPHTLADTAQVTPMEPATRVAESDDVANYELTELPPLVEPYGWALQIGAYRTEKALMRGWTILYRANADILGDLPPRRSEVNFGDRESGKPRGFYYRLNAGPLKSLSEARTLCRELLSRGTECWVRPPEDTEGRISAPEDTNSEKGNSVADTAMSAATGH